MSDPQWFYSSLAQVSAGLVGLLGGFLLVRLSSYIAEWRDRRTALLRLEREWHAAERAALRTTARDTTTREAAREARERTEDAWFALRVAADERETARFPGELVLTLVVLAALLASGVVAPLVALGAPGNTEQVVYVAVIALLVVGVGLVMTVAAARAFAGWRLLGLADKTEARLAADRADEMTA